MARRMQYTPDVERFSTAWWLGRVRNLFWVTVITAMIWVYSDLEISEVRQFTATLRLTTGKATQKVLLTPADIAVTFNVKSSRRTLDDFSAWLDEHDDVIEVDLSDQEPGDYDIAANELLGRSREMARRGLKATEASPSPIKIRLDNLVTRKLPVKLDYRNAEVADDPLISPAEVAVTAAESVWKRVDLQGAEPVILTIQQDLSQREPGREETFSAPLIASVDGERVQLNPLVVDVTLTVSQRTTTRTIKVNVRALNPAEWGSDGTWEQYELERQDPYAWRPDIEVTGAETALAQLRPEDVLAYIEPTDQHKMTPESWDSAKVQIRFPEGLRVELVGDPPLVDFRLARRNGRPTP